MKTDVRILPALVVLAAFARPVFGQAAPHNRFAAEYVAMPLEKLRTKMGHDVPTRRRYVAEAVAAKGAAAWPVLKPALADKDWRVQSCAIESIVVRLEPLKADASAAARRARGRMAKEMEGVVPALEACLGAPEYWVRCRAAVALGMFREQAEPAAAALAAAADDEDWWVRAAAIEAVQQVTDRKKPLVEAARNAVRRPCTSFAILRQCVPILRKHGMDDPGVAEAVLRNLANPGQGMWSGSVGSALAKLLEANPRTEAILPLLTGIVTDRAYRAFDNDPRKAACEALGKLGPKARKALPALRKALAAEKRDVRAGKRKSAESLVDLLEAAIRAIQ